MKARSYEELVGVILRDVCDFAHKNFFELGSEVLFNDFAPTGF